SSFFAAIPSLNGPTWWRTVRTRWFRSSSLPEPGQCCPKVERQRRNSDLISKEEFVLQPGLDFNSNRCICEPVMLSIAGPADEPRQTGFRSDHGAPAVVDLQTLRCSLRRRAQGQTLLLSRPISVHGVCATHMARELTRYRGLPASTQYEALSSWHPRQRSAQHSG